jgi:hypothetical protein
VSAFEPISSTCADAGGIFDGQPLSPAELELADRIKGLDPTTAQLPTPRVAILLRRFQESAGTKVTAQPLPLSMPSEPPEYKVRAELRRANAREAAACAQQHGLEYREANRVLNEAVGIRSVTQADTATLRLRLTLALRWRQDGQFPSAAAAAC